MSDVNETLNIPPVAARETHPDSSTQAVKSERSSLMRTALVGLTVVGFALPVAAYFWFIHQYGVNMIWEDQWGDVRLLGSSYSGNLGIGTLWAQHTQDRRFFPNLLVLLLGHTTHLNVVFEEYLGGVMLVGATCLFILTHRRRSPSTPWLFYCPVAIVMLSFVQGENTLWGFQIAWYLVMLMLALALYLLDRPAFSWLTLITAITVAIVGSYSSVQGLLIWPVGLVILYHRHRPKAMVFTWIIAALGTGAVFFNNFDFQAGYLGGKSSYVLHHPLTSIKFFFSAVGISDDVVGIVIFAVAIWVVIRYGLRRDEVTASPIGVALACFGLLFAAVITEGRASKGLASGYETFNLLILVGSYLAVLDRPSLRTKAGQSAQTFRRVYRDGPLERLLGLPTEHSLGRPWRETFHIAVLSVLVGAICLTVLLGFTSGLPTASVWHHDEVEAVHVTLNINRTSDRLLVRAVIPNHPLTYAPFVRQMTEIAQRHRLSLFDNAK